MLTKIKRLQKILVLDTNVIESDPECFQKFDNNVIVIPTTVIAELDSHKVSPGEHGYNARKALRELEKLRKLGSLKEGVPVGNKGTLMIEDDFIEEQMPSDWNKTSDDRIIQIAKGLKEHYQKCQVILVSNDTGVRIKAGFLGIEAEEYLNQRADEEFLIYNGRCELTVTNDEINEFNETGTLKTEQKLCENEFVVLMTEDESEKAIGKYEKGYINSLEYCQSSPFGIHPRNIGQKFAIEALMTPAEKAPLVILKGSAGTAKTFVTLACALQSVIENRTYRKLLITRANVEFDKDIGALPGTEEEKVGPLLRGCMDNLELLVDEKSVREGGNEDELQDKVQELFDRGYINIEALGFLRGRSVTNQIMLIDEAQNTTPSQMTSILTRAGEGTKIVICGDLDQIDAPHLDKHTNGLAFALEKMAGSDMCYVVGFDNETESTRSSLAREAAIRMTR